MSDGTDAVLVPGLEPWPGADTPAERRRRLRAADDDELVERVVAMALALRGFARAHLGELAAQAGLPPGEVAASPFALRAVARAVAMGCTTQHHELRVPIAWAHDWQAGQAVADEEHGAWVRGVLHSGKYQAFLHDEPFASYNPVHMAKWAPHELTHRACRFFWRADMTRWELYLGSRLNELVPVVLWYGPDEVLRLDRDGFDRARDQAEPEAPVGRARWLREEESSLRARASRTARHLRLGIEHVERELAAIDVEIEGGRQVVVEHPFLDSATDATAYVVGHWARLTSPTTGQLIEGLLTPGVDYETCVLAYREAVERELDAILFGPLRWPVDPSRALIAGKHVWDWLQRIAQAGPDAFEAVADCLPEAREALESARQGHTPDLDAWADRLSEPFEDRLVVASGDLRWCPDTAAMQLYDGISSVIPATVAYLEALGLASTWVEGFATSDHLRRRAPLAQRVEDYTLDATFVPEAASLLAFELALLSATERDDQVERLGRSDSAAEAPLEAGRIIPNRGFRLQELEHDVAELHARLQAGEPVESRTLDLSGPAAYLIGAYFDAVAVLPASAGVRDLWRRLGRGAVDVVEAIGLLEGGGDEASERPDWPSSGADWLDELLAAGAVGWVPRVSGGY